MINNSLSAIPESRPAVTFSWSSVVFFAIFHALALLAPCFSPGQVWASLYFSIGYSAALASVWGITAF
jgi:hypothetical protein